MTRRERYRGMRLRWSEIREGTRGFVNCEVRVDLIDVPLTDWRREWCSVPWADRVILDPGFGRAMPVGLGTLL